MVKLIEPCPLTYKSNCPLCKQPWLGWIDAKDSNENKELWEKYCKQQQERHNENWYKALDSLKLKE